MFPNNFPTLKVLSTQDLNLKIELMKLDVFIQRFLPGQELSGQVVKSLPGNKAVVQFSGEQVLLEMDRPARAGESLSVKVEDSHPAPTLRRIDTPAHLKRQVNPEGRSGKQVSPESDKVQLQRPARNFHGEPGISSSQAKDLGLKPGQKIEVAVSSVVDQQVATVKYKGQTLTARVPPDFAIQSAEGKSFSATVVQNGSSNQLSLLLGKPLQSVLDPTRLQEYLPARTALSNTLSGLNRALAELNPQLRESIPPDLLARLNHSTDNLFIKDVASLNAVAVKEQVSKSGINYESHLRNTLIGDKGVHQSLEYLRSDTKGQLLSLSNHLATALKEEGGALSIMNELKNLAGQVRSAVQNIELQQLSQNLARQDNQPMVLQIPNQLFGADHTIQLFVRQEKDSSGNNDSQQKKSWNLVFFLDLTALGSIRVDTRLHEDQVEIKISAENESILHFMETQFGEFEKNLEEMGFSAQITGTVAVREDMELEDPLDNHLKTDIDRLVDIKT